MGIAQPIRRRSATEHSEPARRLLEATIDAIDRGGESAVRVHDIADAAGVQIPVLYRHFQNREGLLQAAQVELLSRTLGQDLEQINQAIVHVNTAEEFRALFDSVLAALNDPERLHPRWRRVNVIGSTYGRPALAAAVSQVQRRAVEMIAATFERPQREGWLREGLDIRAFGAWFAGQTLGRLLIELGDVGVDETAWNAISADAVRHVMFGPDPA
jgi:AcrR family transcriptional regulator